MEVLDETPLSIDIVIPQDIEPEILLTYRDRRERIAVFSTDYFPEEDTLAVMIDRMGYLGQIRRVPLAQGVDAVLDSQGRKITIDFYNASKGVPLAGMTFGSGLDSDYNNPEERRKINDYH